MTEPTDADRTAARELALLARAGVGGPATREEAIAQALVNARAEGRAEGYHRGYADGDGGYDYAEEFKP